MLLGNIDELLMVVSGIEDLRALHLSDSLSSVPQAKADLE